MKMKNRLILIPILLLVLIGMIVSFYRVKSSRSDAEKILKIHEMYISYKKKQFPQAKDISVKDIMQLQESNDIVFVDVRTWHEQDVSRIQESIAVDIFDKTKEEYRDKIIVAYCTVGSRSGIYTQMLLDEGFNSFNMIGGILMWAHEGKELYGGGKNIQKAHVYGEKWDLLPSNYESVY